MRTTATNRKIRLLLTAVANRTLIPRPEFQRRLVWSNRDKLEFIKTVLEGFPFPEIYIAAGSVNPETGEGTEMLVDGQQRITTLFQYFKASPDLILGNLIPPYARLEDDAKIAFLEYEAVVRDLGRLEIVDIKRIFERINSANYALNAMEVHNARYAGAYKQFAETLSEHPFFQENSIFSLGDTKRMQDIRFCLILTTTVLSTYFNRDEELEQYLERYNDEFPEAETLKVKFQRAFDFIVGCDFARRSRVWKRADLLTLIVEYIRAIYERQLELLPSTAGARLKNFYDSIDQRTPLLEPKMASINASARDLYYKASIQATNDRGNRVMRGEIVQAVLDPSYKLDLPLSVVNSEWEKELNQYAVRPQTESANALLRLIQEYEGEESKMGLTEIFDSLLPGMIHFLPHINMSGGAHTMAEYLFREGVNELVETNWLHAPIKSGNTLTYRYKPRSSNE